MAPPIGGEVGGWTWIRPRDPDLLGERPLLDLGTGDGQTLRALTRPGGLVVGLDRSFDALRAARRTLSRPLVAADARRLPISEGTFRVVLAGDLVHHLDDHGVGGLLGEALRVLRSDGWLVAWWYAHAGRPGPDAPRFPRRYGPVADLAERIGFASAAPLELDPGAEPARETAGIVARR